MSIGKFTLQIFIGLFLFCLQTNAQISTREIPTSFKYDFGKEQIPVIVMPDIDISKLQVEDKEEEQLGMPPRFGFIHPVNLNLLDAGVWHTLENGDKLCQLTIVCQMLYLLIYCMINFGCRRKQSFLFTTKTRGII